MVVLRERVGRWQMAAVLIAGVGIAIQLLMLGELPWISLVLAHTGFCVNRSSLMVYPVYSWKPSCCFPWA